MSMILLPQDGKYYEPLTKTVSQSLKVISDKGDIQVFDYQPGNGTRYVLSFTRLPGGEVSDVMGAHLGDTHMMVLHNIGTRRAVFVGRYTQYYDINDKLGVGNADCLALLCLVRYMSGDTDNLTLWAGVSK